ncbi:MAG: hypothetical protein VCB25_05705, partial [Myxococcota bacterium]
MSDAKKVSMKRCHKPLVLFLLIGWIFAPTLSHGIGNEGADGDFERRDSFHFRLFQDVDLDESGGLYGSRNFEQQVLRQLEGAYDLLDSLLSLRPTRKIEVYVWDSKIFD